MAWAAFSWRVLNVKGAVSGAMVNIRSSGSGSSNGITAQWEQCIKY